MSCLDSDERWLSEADEQGNCTAYVTVEAPASSNVQITADKRSFPATFKFLIDNIAHLFATFVDKSSTQTIDGEKTFTGNLIRSGTGTIIDYSTGAIKIIGEKITTIDAKQTITGTSDIEITGATAKLDIKRPTTFNSVPTLPSQTAKSFFAAPTGSDDVPLFRTILATDLPVTITSDTSGTAAKATNDKNGADITTTYATKTERSDNDITAVSLSGNTIILTKGDATTITATVGALSVNTSGSAAKLTTARTISISGKATGTATSFDGSGNISIPITAIDATGITSGTLSSSRLPLSASVTGNNYAVQSDASGKLFVAVPWTNTIYTHPTSAAVAKTSGLYKITTDATGHITAATAVAKSDITALGIPGQDTNTWPTAGNGLDGNFNVKLATNPSAGLNGSSVKAYVGFDGTGLYISLPLKNPGPGVGYTIDLN